MATAQDVQQQLATIKAPGTFATRRSSPADDLRLEVTGVGRTGWPITRETARKLWAVARPARYGLKDETRFHPRVRDCWEIPKSRISIDGAHGDIRSDQCSIGSSATWDWPTVPA